MFIANPLNSSTLTFPILECFHILGFVSGVGTIALVNFRLLGIGLTRHSPAQLWRATFPWTLSGLCLVIFSGLLQFSTDPDMYYQNYIFDLKIALLVLAILFYYTVVRGTVALPLSATTTDAPTGRTILVASISLLLWASVLFGGIFIAFA